MRSKLLKSFLFVTLFWWVGSAMWWSLSSPEVNEQGLEHLARLLPWVQFDFPERGADVLNAWRIQKQVFLFWSLPLLAVTGILGALGAGIVWFFTYSQHQERLARTAPGTPYRGVNITLGPLPLPAKLPRDILELSAEDSGVLTALSSLERALLVDILGIISAAPDAFAGEGHAVNLFEMTLASVELALDHKTHPGLAAIVAAASELGKITAYRKEADGSWTAFRNPTHESATRLANLDSWWALPRDERLALVMAVRYRDNPKMLEDTSRHDAGVRRLARTLLYKAAAAAEEASQDERQRVLTQHELPELAFEVFLSQLDQFGFQDGLPKGVPAVGWKVGRRLYLLEIKLREVLMAKLPEDVREALKAGKEKRALAPFTVELMKGLNTKGWLVKEINGTKLTAREALWSIQAGKLAYKGVIVVDVPDEYVEKLPTKDSIYAVSVTGPLFANAGSSAMSAKDLMASDLLRPSQKN